MDFLDPNYIKNKQKEILNYVLQLMGFTNQLQSENWISFQNIMSKKEELIKYS